MYIEIGGDVYICPMVGSSKNDGIIASRIPKDLIVGLDELVTKGAFENRSGAIRRAIYNLLVATKTVQERVVEPHVNLTNTEDEVSNSLKELFAMQGK